MDHVAYFIFELLEYNCLVLLVDFVVESCFPSGHIFVQSQVILKIAGNALLALIIPEHFYHVIMRVVYQILACFNQFNQGILEAIFYVLQLILIQILKHNQLTGLQLHIIGHELLHPVKKIVVNGEKALVDFFEYHHILLTLPYRPKFCEKVNPGDVPELIPENSFKN